VASVQGGGNGDGDVYGFINGYAGGDVIIADLKPNDTLVFGGYAGDPIASENVVKGGDLIVLTDNTKILIQNVDHRIFS
jgi:hypothetical protein